MMVNSILAAETLKKLTAIAELTDLDRTIIYLRYGEDYYYREIAEYLAEHHGIYGQTDGEPYTEGAIRHRVKRSMSALLHAARYGTLGSDEWVATRPKPHQWKRYKWPKEEKPKTKKYPRSATKPKQPKQPKPKQHNPRKSTRGENNYAARLTADDVLAIRRRYSEGGVTQAHLAQEYSISPNYLQKIIYGTKWKHLPVYRLRNSSTK